MQFVRDGIVTVITRAGRQREEEWAPLQRRDCVWQGKTLSSVTFCLAFWSKMEEVLDHKNSVRPVLEFHSYADDFAVTSDEDEANGLWTETSELLKTIGF